MEEIDLKDLLGFFRKKLLIIVLVTLLFVGIGSLYTFFIQKPDYKSQATVVLGSSKNDSSITQNEVNINKNLVDTYARIVKSRRVIEKALSELHLSHSYEDIAHKVSVTSLKDTEIIEITVTSASAKEAKDIADAISKTFIKEVSALYKIENANILDHAIEPTEPYNIEIIKQESIYVVAGVIIGSVIVFLIYYFDRTVKTLEQIEKFTKLPILGKVRKTKSDLKDGELCLKTDPKSRISEDFRTIRTNLGFSVNGKETKVVLFTSSNPSEGKSFIVSNIAIAFAKAGKKTLLIDCDMRLGRLHEIFKTTNTKGLSTLLAEHKISKYPEFILKTKIANLGLIPRGVIPPNPSELLENQDIERLLAKVRMQYDYIILDGTPVDEISDALILAKKVDRVAIVCSSGQTNVDTLVNTKKSLTGIKANIAGVILNKAPESKKSNKYSGYYL